MQDFNQQIFLQENLIFHKAPAFQFQPSDSDTVGSWVAPPPSSFLNQTNLTN